MLPKLPFVASLLIILSALIDCGTGGGITSTANAATASAATQVNQNQFKTLQQAVSAACNGTKAGVVVLSTGTTTISSPVKVPSNCTIEGAKAGSTVKLAAGVNDGYVFETESTGKPQNITLKNFAIDGSNAEQSPTGAQRTGCVRLTAVTSFHLDNIECMNAYNHGFQILDGSSHGWIENNRIHDNLDGTGIMVGTGKLTTGISDIHITGNNVGPTRRANCIFTIGAIGTDYGVSNVTVSNNVCRQPGDVGIEIGVGTTDATVEGNQVFTTHPGSAGIMARGSRNVRIIGNEITGSGSQTEDGVFVWGNTPEDSTKAHTIRIDANTLRDQGRNAINISSSNPGDVDGVCIGTNTISNTVGSLVVSSKALNVTPAGSICK